MSAYHKKKEIQYWINQKEARKEYSENTSRAAWKNTFKIAVNTLT
ncbi:hypothetical protein SynBIOSE41_03004 [Synechococcus sp. BIOS-E4-1]|nr:hypothetical protein SynBIOSE41_03004 [Synechococcus sp. BIOS-E4-1]